jgi:hypothetical protein
VQRRESRPDIARRPGERIVVANGKAGSMTEQPMLPAPVATAIEIWLDHHDRLAPGLIEGLYLVGSIAFGDWTPHSDIDIIAFTADPATDADVEVLRAAHERTRDDLEIPIDGPRLAWGDVSVPPLAVHRPWSLDGEFRTDGECFEINPVTWFTLAHHGLAVRGEPASRLSIPTDRAEMTAWIRGNVDMYWRGVRLQVEAALEADLARDEFSAAMTEWCALGPARMWFTVDTGDVTSKSAAGRWAATRLAHHRDVLELAVSLRAGAGGSTVDRDTVVSLVDAMASMIDAITGSR